MKKIDEIIDTLIQYRRAEKFGSNVDHLLNCYQARPIPVNPYQLNYVISGIRGSGKTMFLKTCYYQLVAIFLMQSHLKQQLSGFPILIEFNKTNFPGINAEKDWFDEFSKEVADSVNRISVMAKNPELYIFKPLKILYEMKRRIALYEVIEPFFNHGQLIVTIDELKESASGGPVFANLTKIGNIIREITSDCSGLLDLDRRFERLLRLAKPIVIMDEMSGFKPENFYDDVFDGIYNNLTRCSNQNIIYSVLSNHKSDKDPRQVSFERFELTYDIKNSIKYLEAREFLTKIIQNHLDIEVENIIDVHDTVNDPFEQLVYASRGIPRSCMEILIKALRAIKDEIEDPYSFKLGYQEIVEAIKLFAGDLFRNNVENKPDLRKKMENIIECCTGQKGFIFCVNPEDWDWVELLKYNFKDDPAVYYEGNGIKQKYSIHYALCVLLDIPTHCEGESSFDCRTVQKGTWLNNIVNLNYK